MIAGVCMMRNEADVAVQVVRHMLDEVDMVIVADNRSTDGTRQLLEAIEGPRLVVVDEPQRAYYQSAATMRLVELAVAAGAEWVVPFDADEWWFCPNGERIADVLARDPGITFPVGSWEMVPQPTDDPAEPDPFRRIRSRRGFASTQKIAFRPGPGRVLDMGNHILVESGSEPGQRGWSSELVGSYHPERRQIVLYHYPYRTMEQARQKVRTGREALEATTYSAGVGQHWRELGSLADDAFARWWVEWTRPMAGLVLA